MHSGIPTIAALSTVGLLTLSAFSQRLQAAAAPAGPRISPLDASVPDLPWPFSGGQWPVAAWSDGTSEETARRWLGVPLDVLLPTGGIADGVVSRMEVDEHWLRRSIDLIAEFVDRQDESLSRFRGISSAFVIPAPADIDPGIVISGGDPNATIRVFVADEHGVFDEYIAGRDPAEEPPPRAAPDAPRRPAEPVPELFLDG